MKSRETPGKLQAAAIVGLEFNPASPSTFMQMQRERS